jgi:hypothetical protein
VTARSTPPTREQLLNLADRAEFNGGLTAAEANRLRAGIAAMDTRRRAAAGRLAEAVRLQQEAAGQLAAVLRLVRKTQRRGGQMVQLRVLARELDDAYAWEVNAA